MNCCSFWYWKSINKKKLYQSREWFSEINQINRIILLSWVLYYWVEMDESQNRSNNLGVTDSPRHGPTLSTSTSSFEAIESYDSELSRLATKTFEKTYTYVTHDMNSSLEDYKLLEQMNRACISKYSDMQQISENLATSSIQLKEKFDNLVSMINKHIFKPFI